MPPGTVDRFPSIDKKKRKKEKERKSRETRDKWEEEDVKVALPPPHGGVHLLGELLNHLLLLCLCAPVPVRAVLPGDTTRGSQKHYGETTQRSDPSLSLEKKERGTERRRDIEEDGKREREREKEREREPKILFGREREREKGHLSPQGGGGVVWRSRRRHVMGLNAVTTEESLFFYFSTRRGFRK